MVFNVDNIGLPFSLDWSGGRGGRTDAHGTKRQDYIQRMGRSVCTISVYASDSDDVLLDVLKEWVLCRYGSGLRLCSFSLIYCILLKDLFLIT